MTWPAPRSRPRPVAVGLGEVLWDLLPGGKQLGGAPANFAYHAQQLGAAGFVVSAVGNDALGHEIIARLRQLGLDTAHVAVDATRPTGTVSVSLDAAAVPSYVIHENVAWDFLQFNDDLAELAARADVICFGTLAQRGRPSSNCIIDVLTHAPRLRILDINLRQQYHSFETIDESLDFADVLKINDDEVAVVARLHNLQHPADLLQKVFACYDIDLIAVTRGSKGSALYSRDDDVVEHPGTPVQKLVDTVGAGDAFTAALAIGLLRGEPLDRINDAANRLAAYVCTQPGATPAIPRELLDSLWS